MASWLSLCVNISSASSTTVFSGPCVLEWLTVNKAVAASITVYNNSEASGAKVATLAAPVVGTYGYGCLCNAGVTVVTDGAHDITVSINPLGFGVLGTPGETLPDDALLMESGEYLLLESGDRISLE